MSIMMVIVIVIIMCVCLSCVCCLAENDQKRSEDALESVSDDEDELIGDAGEWAGINRFLAASLSMTDGPPLT